MKAMKKSKYLFMLAAICAAGTLTDSCTKLDKKLYSVTETRNFYRTPAQINAGIATIYTPLTNIPDGNVFQLNEASTDEMVVPTRGGDWYDGGKWQSFYLHTWTPGIDQINDTWNDINNGISSANFTLNIINNLAEKPSNVNNLIAEIKVARAYYYFLFMDMFGNVPLVSDYNTDPAKVVTVPRAQVYSFIESELTTNIPLLSEDKTTTYGRFNKWGGYMLQAKLYLNAQVYTGTPQYQKALDAVTAVINSGKYSMSANYLDNFTIINEGSPENILVVPFDNANIGGNGWETQTLHYAHRLTYNLTGNPNNGFCAPTGYYNSFTADDKRKSMFLVGQQFDAAGKPLVDAQRGNTLVIINPTFNTISDASDAFRLAGARSVKYQPQPGTNGNQSNDMAIFRLADAYLMQAEALMRLGRLGEAATAINVVRARAGVANWTAADITDANVLAERGREMSWETWRRNDLIRFEVATGTKYFTGPRSPAKVQDPDNHYMIYPIPSRQLASNTGLKQNPGY
jgi:hypothetical protein